MKGAFIFRGQLFGRYLTAERGYVVSKSHLLFSWKILSVVALQHRFIMQEKDTPFL